MKPVKISSKLLRELLMDQGANGINDAIKNYTSKCISDGVGPATTAALAAGGASALPFIGVAAMILGPILWDVHKDKKDAKQKEILDRKLDQFQEVVERMAGDASNAASFSAKTDRMLEELIDGNRPVWARLNGLDKQQIADKVTEETRGLLADMFETIGADFPKVLDYLGNIEVLSFDTNFIVRESRKEIAEVKGDTAAIRSDMVTRADLEDFKKEMLSSRSFEQSAVDSTPEDVAKGLERVARDAESGVVEARRVIESKDGVGFGDYLEDKYDKIATFKQELDERVRQEQIELNREIAAVRFLTGRISEAEAAVRRLLELIPNDLEGITRLGDIHRLRGELSEAEREYQRILEAEPGKVWRAVALGNLGLIEVVRGNLDRAEYYHERVVGYYTELRDKAGMAAAFGNLGLIQEMRGNLDKAENCHNQSLVLNTELENMEGMAAAFGNLGLIERLRGNLIRSEGYHRQSLAIEKELGRKEGMANQLGNLGLIEQIRVNLDEAEGYHKQSLALNTELGRKEGMAAALGNLGVIEQIRGNLDEAEGYHKQSLDIATELGRKESMAAELGNLGLIEEMRGNTDKACKLWRQSLALYKEIGAAPMVERVSGWLARHGCD